MNLNNHNGLLRRHLGRQLAGALLLHGRSPGHDEC
jgi:hypothetical protein